MTWLLFSFGIIFFYTSHSINKIEANFSSHRVISLQFCASRTELFTAIVFLTKMFHTYPGQSDTHPKISCLCCGKRMHYPQPSESDQQSLLRKKHFRVYSVICTTKSIKCVLRCLKICQLNYTLRNKETEKYERVACIALRNEAYINSLLRSYSKKNEQTNKTKQK